MFCEVRVGFFLLFLRIPLIQVVLLWCGLDVFLPFICISFLPLFFFNTVLLVIARSTKSAEVSVEQKSGFVFVGITSCVCHSLGGVRYLVKRVRSPTFVVAEAYVQAY